MSVYCLIPARKGSKGVKSKNIKPLGGVKSLIERAADVAAEIGVDQTWISTDYVPRDLPPSLRPIHHARPASLASDKSAMSEVIVEWAQKVGVKPTDTVLLLQPTTLHPKRGELIAGALRRGRVPSMAVDRYPDRWHPWYAIDPQGSSQPHLPIRRQALPLRLRPNGLWYLLTGAMALKGVLVSVGMTYVETPGALNIDTPEDWADAERLYGR